MHTEKEKLSAAIAAMAQAGWPVEYHDGEPLLLSEGNLAVACFNAGYDFAPTPGACPVLVADGAGAEQIDRMSLGKHRFGQAICELINHAEILREDGCIEESNHHEAAALCLYRAPAADAPAPGSYAAALRIPTGQDVLALSRQLRADAEQTRVRHSIRTAHCAVAIDDLVRFTVAVEAALSAVSSTGGGGAAAPLLVNDAERRYLQEIHETLPISMSDFLHVVLKRAAGQHLVVGKAAGPQPGFDYAKCPECDADAVIPASWPDRYCPVCAGDKGEDVKMSRRPAMSTDVVSADVDHRLAAPADGN